MGTTSSAQRGSKCAGDAVAEESNGANEMPADGNIDDKLLQKNGQISSLHEKTEGQVDELNGHCEEQVNTEVGSSFVSLKEDNIESLQGDGEPLVRAENEKEQAVSTPDITLKEENEGDEKMDDINEVGFKKIFRFVGLKFTLKKDKYEKPELKETSTSEKEEGVVSTTEESKDTQEESVVDTDEQNTEKKTSDEPVCGDASLRSDAADLSPKEDIEIIVDQVSEITEPNKEATSDKGLAEEVSTSPQVEEAMSPIKRFFTQGIFASLKKKKRSTEEELSKEKSREDVKTIDKEGGEKASEEGAKDVNNPCVCLETTILQEGTDSPAMKEGDGHKTAMEGQSRPECELLSSQERAKVQGSPLKRLFRKLSTRRQRESKAAETKVTEAEQPQETKELGECLKVDEPKPSEGEQVTDAAQDEPKKRSDSSVSWEALICGGSGKKRARKTSDSEDETANKEGLVPEKPKESSPGSSLEGDYDNLTSSNEQPGSPLEGDGGSTWKSLKKLVTPKRKVRAGVNASTEEIPSDNETSKDESSFSIKKIIPEHKKRMSDEARDETSSDEAVKGVGSEDEDDQTPAVVPLSEYETNEPENRREELTLEIPLDISKEKEIIEEKGYLSMSEEAKPIENLGLETSKAPCDAAPSVPPRATEDFEEFTEFISKHQQLSDIPEEGVLEESAVTLVSSAEGNQDDTLAEDVVELTSDAVTAPEHVEEESLGDETTEMVSAVSQLTESPKTSGNATPVPAEYVERETESILRESLETICMASGFQSVTTKDEVADTTAVLLSRHILHSVITGERKVLVAHDKTDATAICTGLVSQEIRGVEEIHPLPMVEGISEVTESIPTELVSADVVEESEAVRVSAGEVFTTEVKEIKIDHQETVSPLIETEQQAVPVQEEPSAESGIAEVAHLEELEKVKEEKEEVNGLQKSMPVHVAITNAVPGVANFFKEQVVSEDTHLPEIEGPLKPATKEPVCGQPAVITEVTVEGGNVHALPNVELLTADVEHAAPAKVVEHVAHDITASIPDTPTEKSLEKSEESIAVVASAVDHPELKETVGIIRPVSDSVTSEAVESVTEAPMGKVSSVHFVEDHEIQVAVKNESQTAGIIVEGVLEVAAGDDSVTVEHPEFKETVSIVRPFSDSVTLEAAETVMEVLTEKLPSESFNDQQVKDESQTATTTSDTVPDVALAEEAVIMEYPEIKETVSTVRAVSDSVTMEAVGPVREVLLEKAPSVHDQEVQDKSQTTAAIVEPLPEVASAHDSTIVVDVCKKEEEIAEEVLVQQGTKTETAKESSKVSEADKVEPEPEVIEPCKEKETSVPEASLDATDISDVKMAGEEQETATKMMTDLSDAAEDVTVPDTHVEQNRTEYVKESVDGGVGTEKDSDLSQVPGSYEQTQGQVAKKEAEALITTECSTEQENQVSETCTGINIQEYVAETIKEEEASTITQEIERPSAGTELPSKDVQGPIKAEPEVDTAVMKTPQEIQETCEVEVSSETKPQADKQLQQAEEDIVAPQSGKEVKESDEPSEEVKGLATEAEPAVVETTLDMEGKQAEIAGSASHTEEAKQSASDEPELLTAVDQQKQTSSVTELQVKEVQAPVKKVEVGANLEGQEEANNKTEIPVGPEVEPEVLTMPQVQDKTTDATEVIAATMAGITEPIAETPRLTEALLDTCRITEPVIESPTVTQIVAETSNVSVASIKTPEVVTDLVVETPIVTEPTTDTPTVTEQMCETSKGPEPKIETPAVVEQELKSPPISDQEYEAAEVSQLKVDIPAVSKEDVKTLAITEQEVKVGDVSESKIETPAITEQEVEKTVVTVLKEEEATVSKLEVEVSTVSKPKEETPGITKPEIETTAKTEEALAINVVSEHDVETLATSETAVQTQITEMHTKSIVATEIKVQSALEVGTAVVTTGVQKVNVEIQTQDTNLSAETPVIKEPLIEVQTSVSETKKAETPIVATEAKKMEEGTQVGAQTIKELKSDKPVAAESEAKSTLSAEVEIKTPVVTEVAVVTPVATEKVETVNVELTGRSKQDAEILETVSGELKEETHVSAADTAEHLTEMEEDVWEDAVDDINFKVDAQGQANQDEKELNINQELDLEFQDAADKNIESCTKNTTC